jgi:hypothetical protein
VKDFKLLVNGVLPGAVWEMDLSLVGNMLSVLNEILLKV